MGFRFKLGERVKTAGSRGKQGTVKEGWIDHFESGGTHKTYLVLLSSGRYMSVAESDLERCGFADREEERRVRPRLNGVRIVVVDDELDCRELLGFILRDQGADVKIAASASEALKLFAQHKPDLLLVDIAMPGEDGYSLVRKVRSLAPAAGGLVPAVAVTAFSRPQDRVLAQSAGFQAHAAKPVDPDKLLNLVASLTGRL
ncbi:MAG TPA: response regulator [Acidobacteriota bacterium]